MLVMILSGPWIEDDVGDIHDCEEDDQMMMEAPSLRQPR